MEQARKVPVGVLSNFDIDGQLYSIEELKRGHINRTYVAEWRNGKERRRLVHQVVNHRIFKDIPGLMRNLEIVTQAVAEALQHNAARAHEKTLHIVKTRDGAPFVLDDAGEYWRTFEFLEDTITHDVCPNPAVASEAAAILGRFQGDLIQIAPASLVDTIPHFHNGTNRFSAFEAALEADTHGRADGALEEILFAHARRDLAGMLVSTLESGSIPTRVSHNDMKLNNVLFDASGRSAVCLLDLDTCMAGTPLYDFGDLVRNTAVPCHEDEQDLSKVVVDMGLYRAICSGYLKEAAAFLTPAEVKLLAVAPRVLALTLGVRFLTDYLQGDVYFRIHRDQHNLERARTQFAVVRAMESLEHEMLGAVQAG
jgi:Ser/Thr protein kinase RdoA (MazF antagonist)